MKIEIVGCVLVNCGKEVELAVQTSEVYKMNTYRFTLAREVWERFGLSEGEIDRDTLKALAYEDEKYRATKKAFDILARCQRLQGQRKKEFKKDILTV